MFLITFRLAFNHLHINRDSRVVPVICLLRNFETSNGYCKLKNFENVMQNDSKCNFFYIIFYF